MVCANAEILNCKKIYKQERDSLNMVPKVSASAQIMRKQI